MRLFEVELFGHNSKQAAEYEKMGIDIPPDDKLLRAIIRMDMIWLFHETTSEFNGKDVEATTVYIGNETFIVNMSYAQFCEAYKGSVREDVLSHGVFKRAGE